MAVGSKNHSAIRCAGPPSADRACTVSQTGASGVKYVPTDPVSKMKSAGGSIVASENCVVAVRSVEPTRAPPTSSYKPTSHDVGAWPAGVLSVSRM